MKTKRGLKTILERPKQALSRQVYNPPQTKLKTQKIHQSVYIIFDVR